MRRCENDSIIVTITSDDDLLTSFGRHKALACLRDEKDGVMFAGPCTGGSAWNRMNMKISSETAGKIKMKRRFYWGLWDQFMLILERVLLMKAFAMLELPRTCDYWDDPRLKELVSSHLVHVHDFDGCMYGLRAR